MKLQLKNLLKLENKSNQLGPSHKYTIYTSKDKSCLDPDNEEP